MKDSPTATYPPLNTLKRVAENVWIVDGPIIHASISWLKIPFPTRMTVIRLADGGMFIHSPTPLTDDLKAEIVQAGTPRWIAAPNFLHYWWLPSWKAAFPNAQFYAARGVKKRGGSHIDFDCDALDRNDGYPWDSDVATLLIAGRYMPEVEFFHRASRTLILTDLIENFEPQKVGSLAMRWLIWVGGVQYPNGGMPRDMRLTFLGRKPQLKAAVETMIGWRPERIIIAHGRWYDSDGANELRRSFRWLLG